MPLTLLAREEYLYIWVQAAISESHNNFENFLFKMCNKNTIGANTCIAIAFALSLIYSAYHTLIKTRVLHV